MTMSLKFFKLHSNGKICAVLDLETNMIGGKGFDAFVKIIEPNYLGVAGWDRETWVAVCRGEFVEPTEKACVGLMGSNGIDRPSEEPDEIESEDDVAADADSVARLIAGADSWPQYDF
ncbi:hypothetical protein C6V07_30995 [Burkholderia gladioli]|nr:hypothetical protein C6V07_30995 [Burkholderia gladioli]